MFELTNKTGTVVLSEAQALAHLASVCRDPAAMAAAMRANPHGVIDCGDAGRLVWRPARHAFNRGDRVITEHGHGVIVGFESFDDEGHQVENTDSPTTPDSRACIELDDWRAWSVRVLYPDAMYYESPLNLEREQ